MGTRQAMVEHRTHESLSLVARIDRGIHAVANDMVPPLYPNPADDPEHHCDDPSVDDGDPLVSRCDRIAPHLPADVIEGGSFQLELRPSVEGSEKQVQELRPVGLTGIAKVARGAGSLTVVSGRRAATHPSGRRKQPARRYGSAGDTALIHGRSPYHRVVLARASGRGRLVVPSAPSRLSSLLRSDRGQSPGGPTVRSLSDVAQTGS